MGELTAAEAVVAEARAAAAWAREVERLEGVAQTRAIVRALDSLAGRADADARIRALRPQSLSDFGLTALTLSLVSRALALRPTPTSDFALAAVVTELRRRGRDDVLRSFSSLPRVLDESFQRMIVHDPPGPAAPIVPVLGRPR